MYCRWCNDFKGSILAYRYGMHCMIIRLWVWASLGPVCCIFFARVRNSLRIRESILAKIIVNKIVRIWMDSCEYFSLAYKVIWHESTDSCQIQLPQSKSILALGCKFLTLLVQDLYFYNTSPRCNNTIRVITVLLAKSP